MRRLSYRIIYILIISLLYSCQSNTRPQTATPGQSSPEDPWGEVITPARMAPVGTVAPSSASSTAYLPDRAASRITWRGREIVTVHTGHLNLAGGVLYVEGQELVAGHVIVDMHSLTNTDITDPVKNADLVRHLLSDDFFGADKFPVAELTLVRLSQSPTGGQLLLSGNLRIRDREHQITLPVAVQVTEDQVVVRSVFSIDRTAWDVRFNSNRFMEGLGDKAIDDEIEISVYLVARPAPVAAR
ncbi:MAG: YceI family protein [Bacteroidia bacterium]|nr:YceI family protein [Bacteroidia bacterium]